ncbi:MAG: hypothetical protein LBJ46_09000 [Planctomycetota bacterium]|jgi:hypothetical protein|nr:hypothetical protein [Planctomycetota bacterium]
MLQLEGNRHDVQGLYPFLETSIRGCLPADNGYWPKQDKRVELEEHDMTVIACTRSNQKYRYTQSDADLSKKHRPHVERFIGLFDQQFNAARTRCRSFRNYIARRWTKALAHNALRYINKENDWTINSGAHLRKVS